MRIALLRTNRTDKGLPTLELSVPFHSRDSLRSVELQGSDGWLFVPCLTQEQKQKNKNTEKKNKEDDGDEVGAWGGAHGRETTGCTCPSLQALHLIFVGAQSSRFAATPSGQLHTGGAISTAARTTADRECQGPQDGGPSAKVSIRVCVSEVEMRTDLTVVMGGKTQRLRGHRKSG